MAFSALMRQRGVAVVNAKPVNHAGTRDVLYDRKKAKKLNNNSGLEKELSADTWAHYITLHLDQGVFQCIWTGWRSHQNIIPILAAADKNRMTVRAWEILFILGICLSMPSFLWWADEVFPKVFQSQVCWPSEGKKTGKTSVVQYVQQCRPGQQNVLMALVPKPLDQWSVHRLLAGHVKTD